MDQFELGSRGGKARAKNLSALKRTEIARTAAQTRWANGAIAGNSQQRRKAKRSALKK
jgi:hypothetical protein